MKHGMIIERGFVYICAIDSYSTRNKTVFFDVDKRIIIFQFKIYTLYNILSKLINILLYMTLCIIAK